MIDRNMPGTGLGLAAVAAVLMVMGLAGPARAEAPGYLGVAVRFETVSGVSGAAYPSAVVTRIAPGSPAELGQLHQGDAIFRICMLDGACQDVPAADGEQWFQGAASQWPAGTDLVLHALRHGREEAFQVRLGVRGAPAGPAMPAAALQSSVPQSSVSQPSAPAPDPASVAPTRPISELAAAYEQLCGGKGAVAGTATCDALRHDLRQALQEPAAAPARSTAAAPAAPVARETKPEDRAYRSPINAASVQAASGDRAGAIRTLRAHLASVPDDTAARIDLARYLRDAGSDDQALDEIGRAVSADPGNPDARNLRVSLLLKRRAFAEALFDLDALIADGNATAVTYINRGVANHNLQAWDEAMADYDKAIAADPGKAAAYVNKGAVLIQVRRERQAVEVLTAGLARDPNAADGYLLRGMAYLNLFDGASAAQDFSRAIDLRPDDPQALRYRAQAYRAAKLLPQAIRDYDTLIGLTPSDTELIVLRGNCRADTGDLAGALADYDRALAMDPANAALKSRRALAQGELDRRGAATAN